MMLLAHNHLRPVYTVTGGALVTEAAAWSDRSPQSAARVSWPTGTQSTTTTCTITASFTTTSVRAVALLATTLPAGLKVELYGKRATDTNYTYALGGSALTQRIVSRLDGGTGAVWVLSSGNDAIVGIQVRLYNDVAGAVAISPGQQFDIGEIVASGGHDVLIESDWSIDGKDPSTVARTRGSQVSRVDVPGYRVLTAVPADVDADQAIGTGLDGTNWLAVARDLRADPYVLAIARTDTDANVAATSVYGLATRIPRVTHHAGPLFTLTELEVEEIPG